MSSEIKVSVCVVTYNQEKYIAECLQSIIDQEVDFPIEIIVSDDCSTDKTPDIIKRFSEKYSFIKPNLRVSNVGPGVNFIQTHSMARGEYVCHLDGDDRWLPGKLKFQVSFMDSNPEYSQMWHFARVIDDEDNVIKLFPSKLAKYFYPRTLDAQDIALSYALVGHHSTQMYRKSARDQMAIDESESLLDYWFAFHYALCGKSYYAKEVFSDYRLAKSDSVTRSKSLKRVTVDVLSDHLLRIANEHPEYRPYLKGNMRTRWFFSKVIGHDLWLIKENLFAMRNFKGSWFLFLRSCFYFLVQKIF